MFIELSIFSVLATLLLFGFIFAGVARFGVLPSYSDYSSMWGKAVPMNNMNVWSIVTMLSAFLLCPALIEIGAASAWQFLGFLTPLYLIIVSLTPNWKTNITQWRVHMIFAALCALGGLAWIFLVAHTLKLFAIIVAFVFTLAMFSGLARRCSIFWGEMIMFLSVYVSTLLLIL